MVLNVHRNHKAYKGRGECGEGDIGWGKRDIIFLSLHCHHQNDSCIKMGSDESHFHVSFVRGSHKAVSTDHNIWRERRADADSNRSPSAYKPNALPLGQTGSQQHWLYSTATISVLVHSWCTHRSSDISGTDVACSCKLKEDHRQPLS